MPDNRTQLPVLFALGFRPLFLAGSLFAVLAIPLWIAAFLGHIELSPAGGWLAWHRHEMVFGFGVAIVAGFLLTAIQAWTGVPALTGKPVLLMAGLWLGGRLCWLFGAPLWLLIPMDLLFLPLVALAIGHSLWKVRQVRNYPIVVMLSLLTLCNLLVLIGLQQDDFFLQRHGAVAALWLIAGLMGLIGGRVIPFFTQRGLGLTEPVNAWPWLDNLLMVGSILVALLMLSGAGLRPSPWQAPIYLALGLGHMVRLLRWHHPKIWTVPLLWSLHLSYAWLALALIAMALWHGGWFGGFSQATHLLAIGGMAGMILAMIARVSLGHTGRPLQPAASMSIAFVLLNLAVPLRVWLTIPMPQTGFWLASLCWAVAFGLYVWNYTAILTAPRPDGRPG
ncbi:uncharacterized protein involved in response to NO [Halopseudomonas litoralis]|uniref:Uncharacterized protein involved in response to NO n=1 Tax=Halopseudomonas litoralis TaxID=797277 RepID=A0A1H1ND68_9GAMM|nr:NnrS family protein [Halopseudomonas litoralis]SDR96857.1 uncharacterized protein involved in response to NO [Halopseudomonas litoralis]